MAKILKIEDAIGEVLFHDITEINPDKGFKGRVFKKGHIIQKEDIEILKKLGKEHIYIMELGENDVHENDAAKTLAKALSGKNVYTSNEPKEGKIDIFAACDGVCKIDLEKLFKFNSIGEPSCPTIKTNSTVKKGDKLAAVRIIPLFAPKEQIDEAVKVCEDGIIDVIEFKPKNVGMIITGNEVYKGLIKDKFYDSLKPKLNELNAEIKEKIILPDNQEMIEEKIKEFSKKYDVVILTGGTSVDPDDVTYKALHNVGVKNFIRGNPIQPGNMLTMGWIDDVALVAVPASAIFNKFTAFDIWIGRILIGDVISKEEVIKASHGGLLEVNR